MTPPLPPDTLDAPAYIPSDVERYLDHTHRGRLSRFWRVAGPITTAQVLFLSLLLALMLTGAVGRGDLAIAAGVFLAPSIAAYFARPLLLRRHAVTLRLMNTAAVVVLIFGLYTINPKTPAPPLALALTVLGYLSFHISAIFWILSDAAIFPSRPRWWCK